jgi:hypothetical protein
MEFMPILLPLCSGFVWHVFQAVPTKVVFTASVVALFHILEFIIYVSHHMQETVNNPEYQRLYFDFLAPD